MSDSRPNEFIEIGKGLIIEKLGEEISLSLIQAVYLYDRGDPAMVAVMIQLDPDGVLLKDNVKKFLVEVVVGKRRSGRPKNLQGDQQDRMNEVFRILYLGLAISELQKGAGRIGEKYGYEPSEWIAKLSAVREKGIKLLCERLELRKSTVAGDLREIRRRIEKYPEL